MKKITNVKDLKQGQKIIKVAPNFEISYFEFLMIHPHNENYILALNMMQDAEKIYIPYLYESYYTDYSHEDINYLKFQGAMWKVEEIVPLIQEHSEWKAELIKKISDIRKGGE